MIKPEYEQPGNVVSFAVSMEMVRIFLKLNTAQLQFDSLFQTTLDTRNYLKKIYQIPVVSVRHRITLGKFTRDRSNGAVLKGDDMKVAYVTLPREVNFKFPDLFPSEAEDKEKKREDERVMDQSKEEFNKFLDKNKNRKGLPGWFSF